VAWVLAILAGGCGPHDEATSAVSAYRSAQGMPDRATLQPVSLPDLSRLPESVQDQMRERHSSLTRKIEDSKTPAAELANAYGEMGLILMAAEYDAAAAACYSNAQALAPDDMRWPYYLGQLYRIKGERAKAAEFFLRALELRPGDLATLVWLGEMYLDQDRPEAAAPLFIKAVSVEPRSAAALSGVGRSALASRDYARAVEYLERALSIDQRASSVHYPLAMAYRGLGDLEKAETHLRQRGDGKATPTDPLMQEYYRLLQSAQSYAVLGVRALENGRWAAAAESFRKGLELAPDDPSLRHRLGTALLMAGDVPGASEQFEETLRRSPEFAKAHFSLGVILESNGRRQEAIKRFAAAVKYQPNYPEALLGLAEALRASGRPEASLAHYEQVVKINPRMAEAWVGRAMALVLLKRFQEARDWLSEGRKVHADHAQLAHVLARLLAAAPDGRARDGARAMVLMQELIKGPPSVELSETMAMTLAELGRYDEAVRWQREAMAAAQQAGQSDLARLMAGNLTLYEERSPCRTPWRDDELAP